MKILRNLAIVSMLAASIACVATLTPVQNVANIGANVERSNDQILKTAQALHAQTSPLTNKPVVSTAQLDQVALVVYKVGMEGENLAQMLTDYDSAKAAKSSTLVLANAITSLIDDMVKSLRGISIIIPNDTVQAIDSLVTSTISLLIQIKVGL